MHAFLGPMPPSLAREGAKVHPEYFVSTSSLAAVTQLQSQQQAQQNAADAVAPETSGGKTVKLAWRKLYEEQTMRHWVDKRRVCDVSLPGALPFCYLSHILMDAFAYRAG